MQVNFTSARRRLDLCLAFDGHLRQVAESSQVFVTRRRSMCVVGSLPIEGSEGSRDPVEVSADNVAVGITHGEIDKEDALGPRVERFRNCEHPLRAIGRRIESGFGAEELFPCDIVDVHGRMEPMTDT